MKINRFIALAAIALLVVGAMGAMSVKVFALDNRTTATQSVACPTDQADAPETSPDTEKIDQHCGDQNETKGQDAVDAPDAENGNEQIGDQNEADPQDAVDAPDAGNDTEQADGPDQGSDAPEVQATATP